MKTPKGRARKTPEEGTARKAGQTRQTVRRWIKKQARRKDKKPKIEEIVQRRR